MIHPMIASRNITVSVTGTDSELEHITRKPGRKIRTVSIYWLKPKRSVQLRSGWYYLQVLAGKILIHATVFRGGNGWVLTKNPCSGPGAPQQQRTRGRVSAQVNKRLGSAACSTPARPHVSGTLRYINEFYTAVPAYTKVDYNFCPKRKERFNH